VDITTAEFLIRPAGSVDLTKVDEAKITERLWQSFTRLTGGANA
jgi:hypothetical protein